MNSDGNSPTANYTGTYSDDANKGQDPAGKVSAYIVGADLAGNAINGGGPGFEDDLVTYVSMSAKSPTIRNFFIEDSNGERLHNPAEGAPRYQGPWNMSMYAGNEYHLIVEAKDDNGWRDIDWFMTWWDHQVKEGQKFMSMSRPWVDYHGGSAETLEEALERHNGVFADHILRGSGISPNGQRYIKESV